MNRLWFFSITTAVVFIFTCTFVACRDENKKQLNLEDYLQPLDVGRNPKYDKLINDDDGKLCSRNCTKYPESRICYYQLVAEQYHAMGPACKNCPFFRDDCFSPQCVIADGIERTILVFNRLLPGPEFHICFGDRVIVDLENKMPAREVTIHWHGQLQKKSPWEDGVPYVTQCPIPSNSKFRYDFLADTSGTHFYHSHESLQLFDGLSGPFVVHTSAKTDPVSSLYDYDLFSHTIQIRDWFHEIIDVRYPGYNKNTTYTALQPVSYLINGMGSYSDTASRQHTNTPLAEFVVKRGNKYRFRIITDTSTTCSLQFAIEDHAMLLIAADGYPVKPQVVRSLFLSSVDIYDVVVTADKFPRPYWIRVQGYGPGCSPAVQQAILRYEGTGTSLPLTPNTAELFNAIRGPPQLNNGREPCHFNDDNLCSDEIHSIYPANERLLETPDESYIFSADSYAYSLDELFGEGTYHRFYLPEGGKEVSPLLGGVYEDTINKISNMVPPFPLLFDAENPAINQMKCTKECINIKHCECLYLIKLGLNNVIEMVFIDKLSVPPIIEMNHPFHIHGHHWSVMKVGSQAELLLGEAFKVNTSNKYPLARDSVAIPSAGFVVVRFIADNPGFWLLHCHFTAHNDNGMQFVIQVGEPKDFPELPEDWPKCGDYLPPVY
ncbi:uncharacterized protein LOC135848699 [Planococcus citri]|uniref:uncharacterized protein LOC135848699 n=1 Tax=Planococcus citri TaxID=170843 RepID=UPI0031F8E04B